MRIAIVFLMVISLVVVSGQRATLAGIGYFSESIAQLHQNAQEATRAESLEGLQEQAKEIMELAGEFQAQAQAVNDMSYVHEAIDIYNSAYRASKSSSLEEARSYARQVVSHTEIVAQQSGQFHHIPFVDYEPREEDGEEIRQDIYYDKVYENSYGLYGQNM